MGTINLRLPDSILNQIRKLAHEGGISINQFISTAAAEKMAALMALDSIEQRAQRGSREKFDAALAQIPVVEPEEYDKL